jgi:hypothetical protein
LLAAARRDKTQENFALQASQALNLDLADANPVSIISQRVGFISAALANKFQV